MTKRKTKTKPLAHTREGYSIHKGDTLHDRRGVGLIIVGREGNVMLVRQFVAASPLRPSTQVGLMKIKKVHPSELGLKSNIKLPPYVKA